jgi:hypothetical protein
MPNVSLFKYRPYIQLLRPNHGVVNTNYPMIQYDIKLYKGVTNSLDFVVRNNDRKPVRLVDYQIFVDIQTTNGATGIPPSVVLTKQAVITDEVAGRAQLILLPGETQDWNTGYYTYAVRTIDGQGVQEYLYTDINKGATGQFQLIETIVASLVPAVEVKGNDFTPTPLSEFRTQWITGALAGDAQTQQANGTHTVAIYTTDFIGSFSAEGSLTQEPPLPSQWFPIVLGDANADLDLRGTGVTQKTFFGNYMWVRFRYSKAANNTGTLDKILYKR